MSWDVEYTDQFGDWWAALDQGEQAAIAARVDLLAARGPALKRPTVGKIEGSRHAHMKELIVEEGSASIRVLFAFDPRRSAILLIGGDKAGDWTGWYERSIPVADDLYDEHLTEINET